MTDTCPIPSDPMESLRGRFRVIEGALVVPPDSDLRPLACGVFDGQGRPVAESQSWSDRRGQPATVFPQKLPASGTARAGAWLFGGVLSGHFGHMLCEGTARLWVMDRVRGTPKGTLFFARPPERARQIGRDQGRFLKLLGCPTPTVVTAPLIVERLVVPLQGFGAGEFLNAAPETRAYLRRVVAGEDGGPSGRRIYLSRAEVPARRGLLLGEAHLEMLFEAEGYEIVRPEELSPEEQIALYRQADCIAGTEGSPFHLVAFAARADARVAVLRRRLGPDFDRICDHLRWFLGREPVRAGVVRSALARENLKHPNMIYLELSLPDMWRGLKDAGMVAGAAPWSDMPETARAASVAAIAADLGRPVLPYALDSVLPEPDGADEAAA